MAVRNVVAIVKTNRGSTLKWKTIKRTQQLKAKAVNIDFVKKNRR